MDFERLVREVYEMGEIVLTTKNEYGSFGNNTKIVGKADEYEDSVEFLFEDDSYLNIDKSLIKNIFFHQDQIIIEYYKGGGQVILEKAKR